MITSPYPKPRQLSDPYLDWDGCEEKLEEILAKNPEDLTRLDYCVIFSRYLPAADYEEGVFYLQPCFDYMNGNQGMEERVHECVFGWIELFQEKLAADNLLQPCQEAAWELFLRLTKEFRIVRLSDEELALHKICESYREMAHNSQAVHDFLESIISLASFEPVVQRLEDYLDRVESPEKSFWFMECEFHTRQWLWLSAFDSQVEARRQKLYDYFHRIERFGAHYGNSKLNQDCKISQGFYQYNVRLSP